MVRPHTSHPHQAHTSKAELLTRMLGKLDTTVVTRIMGLVLAFLAVQYVLDGLATALGRG